MVGSVKNGGVEIRRLHNRHVQRRPPAAVAARQGGLTLISWIFVLAVVGIFILAAARLVPAYMEYFSISSALNNIRKEARTASLAKIRSDLSVQLNINGVEDVSAREFRFQTDGNNLTISINHDINTPFIANLGFVVHCDRSITVKRSGSG